MDARGRCQGQLLFHSSVCRLPPSSLYVVGSYFTSSAERRRRRTRTDETASVIPSLLPPFPRVTVEEKLPALTFGTAAKFGNENFAATTAALPSFILPELEQRG